MIDLISYCQSEEIDIRAIDMNDNETFNVAKLKVSMSSKLWYVFSIVCSKGIGTRQYLERELTITIKDSDRRIGLHCSRACPRAAAHFFFFFPSFLFLPFFFLFSSWVFLQFRSLFGKSAWPVTDNVLLIERLTYQ